MFFFSSRERIPPFGAEKSNNKLQSNNKLPGNQLWPILSGFLLLEQKEHETETIASPFRLPIPPKKKQQKMN